MQVETYLKKWHIECYIGPYTRSIFIRPEGIGTYLVESTYAGRIYLVAGDGYAKKLPKMNSLPEYIIMLAVALCK